MNKQQEITALKAAIINTCEDIKTETDIIYLALNRLDYLRNKLLGRADVSQLLQKTQQLNCKEKLDS